MHEAKFRKWLTKAQHAWVWICYLERTNSRKVRFCTLTARLRYAWAT